MQPVIWEYSLGLCCVVPVFPTNSPKTADFGVLRALLQFTSRGAFFPVNYLDLFSLGIALKDKAVKFTRGTPRINGPLKCQNLLGGAVLPCGCKDAPERELYVFPKWKKESFQC